MLGLKRPADERGEPAAAILLFANALQMLDALLDCLDVAEHHRGTRFQSELVRNLHHFQPLVAVDLQWRNFLAYPIHKNFAATTRNRSESGIFEFGDHFTQWHPESFREVLEFRRAESVNVDVWIFFAYVLQEIDVPNEWQFWMVPPLHQYLNPTFGGKFIEFLIDLFERKDVMIFVFLGAIERAELAVNVAHVRVIDVSIDDVGNDLISLAVVGQALRLSSPFIGQGAKFFQRQAIKFERFIRRNSFACEHFFPQPIP